MPAEQHPGDAARPMFQCARCGVESSEPTCFVIPGPKDLPRDIRCITCEERRLVPSTAFSVVVVLGSIVWPLLYLGAFQKRSFELGWPVLVFACLMYPVAIIAHEIGHALTAYLVGLEVGAIGLGSGRVVGKFEFLGLPIRLHVWPISGRVHLGAPSLSWLRTRLWITTLMGPMTNALLLAVTVIWWPSLESVFGAAAVSLWFWVNLFLLIGNLIPRRARDLGQPSQTDGLALLTLPSRTREQLNAYKMSAHLTRALFHFEDDNFSRARGVVTDALRRDPENVWLQLLQATSYLADGDYRTGLDIIKPLTNRTADEHARARAIACNGTAFGLTMTTIGAHADDPQLLEADRLSAAAFDMFPCILDYRLTRALVLAATDRPLQAQQLLAYPLFDTARPKTQAQRAAVLAFAHHQLGNVTEAEGAAALALQLDGSIAGILRTLGIAPSPTARAIAPPKSTYVPLTAEHEAVGGANLVLARLAGAILLLFGIGLLALIGLSFARANPGSGLFVPIVFGVIAVFCCSVGYRLTFNRPTRNGSILSPGAWVVLAIVFAGLGLLMCAAPFIAKTGAGGALVAAAGLFAFAAVCWKARAARRS